MGNFTKWIAGGIGWALLGPIGGIVGFFIGEWLEGSGTKKYNNQEAYFRQSTRQERRTTAGDYVISLMVLVAAVMKADGKILKSELDYVKDFLKRSWGVSAAKEALVLLRDLLNQNIPVADVCRQIAANTDSATRLQMLHFLFGIAAADGLVDDSEFKVISHIAANLGINDRDFNSIKSMFVADVNAAYNILEISPDASIDEIKKAYRKMAVKYHPDKVSYLGEEFQAEAKEKFQKVNEAYEQIKKQRQFN
ncbi:MAG: TerB family tellurite resistance protein [Mangrovibacterium sp.]